MRALFLASKIQRRASQWLVVALAAGGGPVVASAAACKITRPHHSCGTRTSCLPIAVSDFARYAASEVACGSLPENRPYIFLADSNEAKGTIVLVHGLTANPLHMYDVAKSLQKSGYNVVVPILTGSGGPEELQARSDLGEWKADVHYAGEIAHLLKEPVFLAGHSTGGALVTLEAAAHPEMYRGVAGFDPTLNLQGATGRSLDRVCLASKVWNFPRQVPTFLSGATDEVEDIPGAGPCLLHSSDPTEVVHQVVNMKVEGIFRKFCGQSFEIPGFSYEFPLAGLCALKTATDEIKQIDFKKLPRTISFLSEDPDIYSFVSKPLLKEQLQANARNELLEPGSPYHGFMVSHCSPGFDASLKRLNEWLKE